VAGFATPTGFAGHAGAKANAKLTFDPDHSVGADQFTSSFGGSFSGSQDNLCEHDRQHRATTMTEPIRSLLKLMAVGVLTLLAVDFLVFRTGMYFRLVEPESTAGTLMMTRLAAVSAYRPEARNIVVIGDSRIGEGFSSRIANQIGEAHGINFIHLGVAGSTPRVWKYSLQTTEQRTGRFAAVVLMATSFQDTSPFEDLAERVLDISYLMPILRTVDTFEFVTSFSSGGARRQALRAFVFPAVAMQNDVRKFFWSPVARIEKAIVWSNGFPGWFYDYPGRPERLPDISQATLAAAVDDPTVVPASLRDGLVAYLRAARNRPTAEQIEKTAAYRSRWFGRIAEYFQSRGTPVFVVQIPRGPFHQTLVGNNPAQGALAELSRAEKLTLLATTPFLDLEEPQFFFDFLHLNQAGRLAFSQRLAEALTRVLP
jgi:hypothetical protein